MKINNYFNAAFNNIFKAIFFIFILSTLLDPMDKFLGLKLYLFIACVCFGLIFFFLSKEKIRLPINMIIFIGLMVFLPLMSITHHFFLTGSSSAGGFTLFKAHLFIALVFVLYVSRIDSEKFLSLGLSILASLILFVTFIVTIFPELKIPLYLFGNKYGIFSLDEGRNYGSAGTYFQMYFVTSSMLVFSVAYYFDRYANSKGSSFLNFSLFILSWMALLLAGSRNNMMAFVLLPTLLVFYYSKNKAFLLFCASIIGFSLLIYYWDYFYGFIDPLEDSNRTKLTTFFDYINIFSGSTYTFLFGEGLGVDRAWSSRAANFVTELTYLEIIRSYGIFFGALLLILLFYPLFYSFILRPDFSKKHLIIAYGVYLLMSFTNPLFFSSMGMFILSILLSLIYFHQNSLQKG